MVRKSLGRRATMRQIKLTKGAYSNLLHNLVEMEDKKTLIIDDQWVSDIKEKEEITLFLTDYLNMMADVAKRISVDTTTTSNEFPFAAVGCLVTIQEVNSDDIFAYKIIPPYKENIEFDDISILSPMGKALLKKGIGELISVQAPGGEFRYKILSINYLEQ